MNIRLYRELENPKFWLIILTTLIFLIQILSEILSFCFITKLICFTILGILQITSLYLSLKKYIKEEDEKFKELNDRLEFQKTVVEKQEITISNITKSFERIQSIDAILSFVLESESEILIELKTRLKEYVQKYINTNLNFSKVNYLTKNRDSYFVLNLNNIKNLTKLGIENVTFVQIKSSDTLFQDNLELNAILDAIRHRFDIYISNSINDFETYKSNLELDEDINSSFSVYDLRDILTNNSSLQLQFYWRKLVESDFLIVYNFKKDELNFTYEEKNLNIQKDDGSIVCFNDLENKYFTIVTDDLDFGYHLNNFSIKFNWMMGDNNRGRIDFNNNFLKFKLKSHSNGLIILSYTK
jgi:hypothetical protein